MPQSVGILWLVWFIAAYVSGSVPYALLLGLARGKRQVDKRQTTKERDWQRQKARVMRDRG